MGRINGYPQYMKRQLPKQAEPEVNILRPVIEGLPEEVLTAFKLEPTAGLNKNGAWLLTAAGGECWVKARGDGLPELKNKLSWLKFLTDQGSTSIPRPFVTEQGELTVQVGDLHYYGWSRPRGEAFSGKESDHLFKIISALSEIHGLTAEYEKEQQLPQDFDWPLQMQARLTDLLFFSRQLTDQKLGDDFQRVYLENFDFVYDQGQEAVQNIVLANCTFTCRTHFINLIGNFLPENILLGEEKGIFCNLASPQRGPRVLDLAIFLRSYLGEHCWNTELVQSLLQHYQEKNPLEISEKYLLLSLMRFPARYWLYMRQYQAGEKSVSELVGKLTNLVYETRLRDRCLDALDSMLMGGA